MIGIEVTAVAYFLLCFALLNATKKNKQSSDALITSNSVFKAAHSSSDAKRIPHFYSIDKNVTTVGKNSVSYMKRHSTVLPVLAIEFTYLLTVSRCAPTSGSYSCLAT